MFSSRYGRRVSAAAAASIDSCPDSADASNAYPEFEHHIDHDREPAFTLPGRAQVGADERRWKTLGNSTARRLGAQFFMRTLLRMFAAQLRDPITS